MEPVTSLATALAAKSGNAAVDVAKEEAKSFLKLLLGPWAETLGEELALRHKERLFNNMVDVVSRAKTKLKSAGVSPTEVPLKIIDPLLEAAALEEEEDLKEMFANLLASAGTEGKGPFSAAFVDVLKQISAEEARFLKLLNRRVNQAMKAYDAMPPENQHIHPMSRMGRFDDLKPLVFEAAEIVVTPETEDAYAMVALAALDNACRLGILRGPSSGRPDYSMGAFGFMFLNTVCPDES